MFTVIMVENTAYIKITNPAEPDLRSRSELKPSNHGTFFWNPLATRVLHHCPGGSELNYAKTLCTEYFLPFNIEN